MPEATSTPVGFDPDPLLGLWPEGSKIPHGWPKHDHCGRRDRIVYHRLSWLLTRHHAGDAHTAAYSVPSIERRLTVSGGPPAYAKIPAGVPMVVFLWDWDCELAHKATGGSATTKADDAWWAMARAKIDALLLRHPGGFAYRSRGGARIVYLLPEPLVIHNGRDELAWKRYYLGCLAYLARDFGIVCDPTISDMARSIRLPFVYRKVCENGREFLEHQRLETVGNPYHIAAFDYVIDAREEDLNLDAARTLATHARAWSPVVEILARNRRPRGEGSSRSPRSARTVTFEPIDAGVLTQLAEDLGRALRKHTQRHIVHRALAGACYQRGVPLAAGPGLAQAICVASGETDDRPQTWQTTADCVAQGNAYEGFGHLAAHWPDLAALVEAALPHEGGAMELRERLDAVGVLPEVPAEEVGPLLDAVIDRTEPGPVLLRATEGAGKTRRALAAMQRRARAVEADYQARRTARRDAGGDEDDVSDAVRSIDKTLYLPPTHAVLEQVVDGLRGLRAEWWRSPLAVKNADGSRACTQYGKVVALAAAGHSVNAWCESPCPDLKGCAARADALVKLGPDRPPAVVVTVHALLDQGLAWLGEQGLLLFDESAEVAEAFELTRAELDAAVGAMELFSDSEAWRGPLVQALAAGLERGELVTGDAFLDVLRRGCTAMVGDTVWDAAVARFGWADEKAMALDFGIRAGWREKKEPAGTVWVKRAGWAPWCPPHVRRQVFLGHPDPRLVPTSKTHALVGRLVCGLVRKAPPGMNCRERAVCRIEVSHKDPSRRVLRGVMASPAIGEGLRRAGSSVFMDATSYERLYSIVAGFPIPVITIRVADGAPVARQVLYWSGATKRGVFAENVIRWDGGLARYLAEGLRRAVAFKPGGTVALFGWKALIDVFLRGDDPVAQQLTAIVTAAGGRLVFGWYGHVRSLDTWKNDDALVSVGDSHRNLGDVRAIAAAMDLSAEFDTLYRHHTAAEISQVSGRLRAPWRTKPGLHIHIGTVAGLHWDARAEVLELPRGLTDTFDGSEATEAVRVYSSARLAAADLGAGERTVRRAVARTRVTSRSHRIGQVTPSEITTEALGLRRDCAESHGNVSVSPQAQPIIVPAPFDDTAQFDLLTRCGGVKVVAELLGVPKTSVYHWATAKNTRRLPDDVRERLEAHLATQPPPATVQYVGAPARCAPSAASEDLWAALDDPAPEVGF